MTAETNEHRHPPRVLIAIPSFGADGKGRLSGIYRYLGENRFWDVVLPSVHNSLTPEQLAELLRGGVDGAIIGQPFDAGLGRVLAKANIPVVVLHDSWMHRREAGRNIHFAIIDQVRIGRLAARHFLTLGRFAAYAFLSDTEKNRWGRGRRIGFERELAGLGISSRVFTPRYSALRMIDRERFERWLAKTPRPLALFAANDRMAAQAVNICQGLGIGIPSDVAILGVNDDETMVLSCNPHLSSIAPDFPAAGYAAAEMLDNMMSGHRVAMVRIFGVRKLVERASTSFLSPSVKLVEDALAFIASCDLRDLSPESVARHLHVSRSLVDLRFRELKRGSVTSAIRTRRIDEVARLLRETDYTIRRIGASCGFENERSLKNIFRRTFGMTMSACREDARNPQGSHQNSNKRASAGA